MRITMFGTFDTTSHPRVAALAEGLAERGHAVSTCNVPLPLDTADRVRILSRPTLLPVLVAHVLRCWAGLVRRARRLDRHPDVVVVGYLGHFDVHLARRLWPRATLVLDHLISAADTAADRGLSGGVKDRLLRWLDRAATAAADIVVVDTEQHAGLVAERDRAKVVVVPVGAPQPWFAAGATAAPPDRGALRVVFFGLFTPLQGAETIGHAAAALAAAGADVHLTMVGKGQDLAATRRAAGAADITWVDWVDASDLPALVADHHVCLGIFGSGPKAQRVVPNKVFQGAAASCAVVTSDTPPQRHALGPAATYVPPADPAALADALARLAADRDLLDARRRAARRTATERFTAAAVVGPLDERLASLTAP